MILLRIPTQRIRIEKYLDRRTEALNSFLWIFQKVIGIDDAYFVTGIWTNLLDTFEVIKKPT
jgi:CHASE1-domain containing sensor protein